MPQTPIALGTTTPQTRRRVRRRRRTVSSPTGAGGGVGTGITNAGNQAVGFGNLTGENLKIAQRYYQLGQQHACDVHGWQGGMFGKPR